MNAKRILTAAAAVLLVLPLLCCGKAENAKAPELSGGIYTEHGGSTGPYVFFDTAEKTWRIGAGIGVSYSVGGSYATDGKTVTASDDGEDGFTVVFEIETNRRVRAVSVTGAEGQPCSEWIEEGKTYETLEIGTLFYEVHEPGEAYEAAKSFPVVLSEGSGVVSGEDLWEEFLEAAGEGIPSTVLIADRTDIESYPPPDVDDPDHQMIFILLEYDGETFSASERVSTEKEIESERELPYLVRVEKAMPEGSASKNYVGYFLSDKADLTMDEIMAVWKSSSVDPDAPEFYSLISLYY
ncbi:MAG: hypothetical protein IJK58_09295 [Clostridia bacterium]|nr:hypothetical protein [Clostridia bacterium]